MKYKGLFCSKNCLTNMGCRSYFFWIRNWMYFFNGLCYRTLFQKILKNKVMDCQRLKIIQKSKIIFTSRKQRCSHQKISKKGEFPTKKQDWTVDSFVYHEKWSFRLCEKKYVLFSFVFYFITKKKKRTDSNLKRHPLEIKTTM
jgi:hypothetical protein